MKAIHNVFYYTIYSIRCYCDCSLGFYSVFCIVGEWFYMKDLLKFLFCLISKTYFYSFFDKKLGWNSKKKLKMLKNSQKIISFIIRQLWELGKKKYKKYLVIKKKVVLLQSQNGRNESSEERWLESRWGRRNDLWNNRNQGSGQILESICT